MATVAYVKKDGKIEKIPINLHGRYIASGYQNATESECRKQLEMVRETAMSEGAAAMDELLAKNLEDMTLLELRRVAAHYGIKPGNKNKEALIGEITDAMTAPDEADGD